MQAQSSVQMRENSVQNRVEGVNLASRQDVTIRSKAKHAGKSGHMSSGLSEKTGGQYGQASARSCRDR